MQEPPAQRGQDGPRQRRGGCRRDQGQARPLQRDLRRRWPSRTPTSTRSWRRWASSRRTIDARRRLGPRLPARAGHGRPALPAAGRRRQRPLRWRAPPRGAVQAAARRSRTCCCSTSPPTTSTPSRVLWLEQHLAQLPRRRRRRHPRPVLPGQRGPVDPRARPRARLPLRGQLLDLPGEEAGAPAVQGKKDAKLAKRLGRRARVGPLQRQGPADQVQVAARALRGDGRRGRAHPQAGLRGDPDPAGPAPGQQGHRGRRTSRKGFGDRVLIEDLSLHPAAQRHRRRHRPQRRRQDHAVQDHRRASRSPTRATSRSATR